MSSSAENTVGRGARQTFVDGVACFGMLGMPAVPIAVAPSVGLVSKGPWGQRSGAGQVWHHVLHRALYLRFTDDKVSFSSSFPIVTDYITAPLVPITQQPLSEANTT